MSSLDFHPLLIHLNTNLVLLQRDSAGVIKVPNQLTLKFWIEIIQAVLTQTGKAFSRRKFLWLVAEEALERSEE